MNQIWGIPGGDDLHESTEAHGSASTPNPLVQLDPGLFIWTILTFLILFFVLAKFAWKPLLIALETRENTIKSSLEDAEIKVDRVNNFVKDYFNDHSNIKLLVPKIDYDSNPFYGLNQLPSFISPFSDEFLEEIIFLKSFVINYLNHIINLNKRESHWIYKGLEIFIINKYINNFYPNVKFLGRLSGISFLENYEVSKIDFNDLFLNYSEYVQRLNLHQTDDQSSEYLTRINQEIASPYHSGVGLIYVENLIGEKDFRNLIEKINNINTRDRKSVV